MPLSWPIVVFKSLVILDRVDGRLLVVALASELTSLVRLVPRVLRSLTDWLRSEDTVELRPTEPWALAFRPANNPKLARLLSSCAKKLLAKPPLLKLLLKLRKPGSTPKPEGSSVRSSSASSC
jgi:hypothetical protein